MSALSKLKNLPSNLPTGVARGRGIKPFVVDKGERMAMGAALGAIKGYYRERAVFKGIGIEWIVGVLGTIGAGLMPNSALAAHLERAGDTGLTAISYALGASWGADKAGYSVAAKQEDKKLPGRKAVVGVIPPRQGGAFLTAEEIANFASPR